MPAISLPAHPSLEYLRNEARALQRVVRAGDRSALTRIQRHHPDQTSSDDVTSDHLRQFPLSAAQLVVAREHGFTSWPRMKAYVDMVAEHGWSTAEQPPDGATDDFCRLACLDYTDDDPARWAQARNLLAAHPELVDADVWAASTAGRPHAVERLLDADPSLAQARGGPYPWRPLFYLAYSRLDPDVPADNVLAVARMLLDAGADPNEGYLWNGRPYPFTVLTGVFGEGEQGPMRQPRHPHSIALARLLLDAGADPNDSQALYNRMFRPDNDHLELLFEYGLGHGDGGPWKARMNDLIGSPSELLRSQLRWAVEHGYSDRVQLLIRHGVDVHAAYDDGRSPLDLAVLNGFPTTTAQLRSAGASATDLEPTDQLMGAMLRADHEEVERLRAQHPGAVETLLQARPGLVVWAAANGRSDTVRLLIELGFDVNAYSRGDAPEEQPWETALHRAAFDGDLAMVQLLISLGADAQAHDQRFDATPLGWAQYAGHEAVVQVLADITANG
ncbi:ankyrin repeat domain-containing protein [Phytoactinopolyspora endophytica]|uniref:ankyrin repeat domain-containing protein n=1 Tax=Phytoactinopolyspora endophytica TaxID=1642495 RepID=UPI00101D637B|nr:ankyrin repeat domain-containing protein [Phytoactinopolyspora endophytica]